VILEKNPFVQKFLITQMDEGDSDLSVEMDIEPDLDNSNIKSTNRKKDN
jgi:hypothetical protein